MGFSQIVGHREQLAVLRQALQDGRLHHAYLFMGPDGVGKKTLAFCVAKAIHCEVGNDDFCGACANCARIQDGNHPEVRSIEPLAGKKEISIQQVRELQKDLNFRSFSGRKKIAVLDPATLMNLPAQNALLKTLEEPPKDSLLILITSNGGGLLSTVRSRCLRLTFHPLARHLVSGFLASRTGTQSDVAELLAAMSNGSLGAVSNIDAHELLARRRRWVERLSSLRSGDYRAAMANAEVLADTREDCLRFLEWAETWYRDLLVYILSKDPQKMVNVDMLSHIQEQSAKLNTEGILLRISESMGARARIERNLNRRMVLENLLLIAVEERC
jgi:DNA polymerase III subunit delta'